MRSIVRRVRSRSPFRRRRKASELIGDIRNLEIDYQEAEVDLPAEADGAEYFYQTHQRGEHERPSETSAIEIVLESSKPVPSLNVATMTRSSRGREREMRTPRVKALAAPVPELVDSRTMSTTDSENSPEKEVVRGGVSKRMSFRDRFMNKKRPGVGDANVPRSSPVRGRCRSSKRTEAAVKSSTAQFPEMALASVTASRDKSLLDNEDDGDDDYLAVDNASISSQQLTPPRHGSSLRPRILARMDEQQQEQGQELFSNMPGKDYDMEQQEQEQELYSSNKMSGNDNDLDYNDDNNEEAVEQAMAPPELKKNCSGLSGIPLDELFRGDHSLLDQLSPTATADERFAVPALPPSSQGMDLSDTPYSVQVNAQQLSRVPVSAITTPGAISGKASWNSSDDDEDDEDDDEDEDSRDNNSQKNKSNQNHNHAKNNNKNEKRQEREPQTQAPSFSRIQSIGEDSIDKVRRALEEVEEEIAEAQKNGRKLSREALAQTLLSVADKLESQVERIAMRRQVSRFIANDKKNGSYVHDDDEDTTTHSEFQRNDSNRATNNSSSRRQQQQQDTSGRNQGSRTKSTEVKSTRTQNLKSRRERKRDENRSMGSESEFTDWAAELEDDYFSDGSKPEADFFSVVYNFFGGVGNVDIKKPATRNARNWDDADADSRTTGLESPPCLDEEDDEEVFAGLESACFSDESNPPAQRKKYEPIGVPSLKIDGCNDFELPPPPHAMHSIPLFGARSTIQHCTDNYKLAPASKFASKRNKAKPTRSSRPTPRSLSPKPRAQSQDDDVLSLSSIESAQYQGRRHNTKSQSRRRIRNDDAVMATVKSNDDDSIRDDDAVMLTVLSKDDDDDEISNLGRNRRDFHIRHQRTSTQLRQRSRSAHAPRQRRFRNDLARMQI